MSTVAEASVQKGELNKALATLQDSIRDDPSNSAYRTFLFQLLAVMGDYNRALTQLNVAADLDAEALLMAQTYRELLQCEGYRQAVFAGERLPLMLGEPPEWMGKLTQALALSAKADGGGAKKLVSEAFDQAATCSGSIADQRFEWLADADMRLGPVLEAIINGKYYWVPFENIAQMTPAEPVDLRDLVWLPVEFKWMNGGDAVGFIPARYPGNQTLEQPELALARKTEWVDLGDEFYIGVGQKTFTSDTDDYPLLQTRSILFDQLDA